MPLGDKCSRCGDVLFYCECPYTDQDWLGPQNKIFCVHCSAKSRDCDCNPADYLPGISSPSGEDEGFTRSGPSGYEPNTSYPESFYGALGGWDDEHRR